MPLPSGVRVAFCQARDETSRLLNIYERLGRFGLLGGLEAAAP
jgi:hypothetical protein